MKRKAGVIVPSYNELKNIPVLVRRIHNVLPTAKIIVVDDSDKKENIKLKKLLNKDNLAKKTNTTLFSRLKKSGRGSAVLFGFEKMLKDKSIQYFFEMDADLSHDPEEFRVLSNAMESAKADVAVGSRYLPDSKTVKWPMRRLILSKLYNVLINTWLGLGFSDYTNGFRLYKRNAVEFLTKIRLKEKGFITLSETAFRLKNNNFVITEAATTFTDRKQGKSSANLKEYISALLGIIRIKLSKTKFL